MGLQLLLPSQRQIGARSGEVPASPPTADRVLSARSTLEYVTAAGLDHFLPIRFLVTESTDDKEVVKRLERVLEEGLERVETPQAARAVVARIEKMSAGHTEGDVGDAAGQQTSAAV